MKKTIPLLLAVAISLSFTAEAAAQEPKPNGSSARAQFESGLGHLLGSTTTDVNDGLRQIRNSADAGYAPAQDAMGAIFNEGRFMTRDLGQSINWYRKAAAQGDGIAATWLGYFFYTGQNVQRDLDAAKKWFSIAADQGDPIAEYYLGLIAEQREYTAAPSLYKKAAGQGLVQAQLKYAAALDSGRGIKRDAAESYLWYLIAADGNTPTSPEATKLETEIGLRAAQQARERSVALRDDIHRARNSVGCFDWPGRETSEPVPPPLSVQQTCRH